MSAFVDLYLGQKADIYVAVASALTVTSSVCMQRFSLFDSEITRTLINVRNMYIHYICTFTVKTQNRPHSGVNGGEELFVTLE